MADHSTQSQASRDAKAQRWLSTVDAPSGPPTAAQVESRPYGYLLQLLVGTVLGVSVAALLLLLVIGPLLWWSAPATTTPDATFILVVVVGGAVYGWLLFSAAPGLLAQGAFGAFLFARSLNPANNGRKLSYATSNSPARALYLPLWHTKRSQFWASVDDLSWTPPLLSLLGSWVLGASIVARAIWTPAGVPGGWPLVLYILVNVVVTVAGVWLWIAGARRRLVVRRKERKALTRYETKQVRENRKRVEQAKAAEAAEAAAIAGTTEQDGAPVPPPHG